MSQSLLNKTLVLLTCFVTNRLRFPVFLSLFNTGAWCRDLLLKDAASVLFLRRPMRRSPISLPDLHQPNALGRGVGEDNRTSHFPQISFPGGKKGAGGGVGGERVLLLALKLNSCPRI